MKFIRSCYLLLIVLLYSTQFCFAQPGLESATLIYSNNCSTSTYGNSVFEIFLEEAGKLNTQFKNNNGDVLKRMSIDYNPKDSLLNKQFLEEITDTIHHPSDMNRLFHFVDINSDGNEDLIFQYINTIGAGPQAGVSFSSYYGFINSNETWKWNDDNANANFAIHDTEFSANTYQIQEAENLFIHLWENERLPIGKDVPIAEGNELLVKPNEKLIFSFKENANRRITVSIAKDNRYLACRIKTKNNSPIEYNVTKPDSSKFTFYKEDNWGFQRYFLINFTLYIENYQYIIYDNYVESDLKTEPNIANQDGFGIIKIDLSSGDKESLNYSDFRGSIKKFNRIPELVHFEYICCDDYGDEVDH